LSLVRVYKRNNKSVAVGRYVEAKHGVNGSSRFSSDRKKRCCGAELRFRREPDRDRLHAPIKVEIEQLSPIPSPPYRLSTCAGNKVTFADHTRRIVRPEC